jgi:hypothetical protein
LSKLNECGACLGSLELTRNISLIVLVILIAGPASAQDFAITQPAGKTDASILAIPRGLASEIAATARDFATFRDRNWQILTLAQIAAASADAETSLKNLRECAAWQETGVSRWVVGSRPDAHKYIVAGLIEITVDAVAGHYLRNHGPIRKWYWRYVWTLPQSLSLYEHAHASNHNAGVN